MSLHTPHPQTLNTHMDRFHCEINVYYLWFVLNRQGSKRRSPAYKHPIINTLFTTFNHLEQEKGIVSIEIKDGEKGIMFQMCKHLLKLDSEACPRFFSSGAYYTILNFIVAGAYLKGWHISPLLWLIRGICPLCPTARHASVKIEKIKRSLRLYKQLI